MQILIIYLELWYEIKKTFNSYNSKTLKDQNKDGTITFKEFLIFQSITAPSRKSFDPEELINMAFNMYDEVSTSTQKKINKIFFFLFTGWRWICYRR